jgi:putative heme-binding domain-containing protein
MTVRKNGTSLTFSPSQKDRLINHQNDEIRKLASNLFSVATTQSIRERIAKYSNVESTSGDPEHGRPHFETRCSSCHALHGIGRSIGPDLREITDRSVKHLVTEIIDPNRVSLDAYQSYEIELRDGTSLIGLIVEETSHLIRIKQIDATLQTIQRDDLIRFEATGRSLMPENLEEGLSPRDMTDLIAFINKTEERTPPPRDPATIAAYIMDPSRSQSDRASIIEVHYALANRLVPHIERQPNASTVLHQIGLTTARRNEETTLPGLLDHLASQAISKLDKASIALWAGLFQGWIESGKDPIEALSTHLDQKDHARLWNTHLLIDQQSNTDQSPSDTKTIEEQRPYPGKASEWHGFLRFDFKFDTRDAIVVMPRKTALGNPWIWRARFFGHEPQLDLALLEKGYHLVYLDVANLFGSPTAVAHWDRFYEYLVTNKHFHKKVLLEGMSRGGLIIYNWANANPNHVAGIYADAPVLDFKSWPGGPRRKTNQGQQRTWDTLLEAYGFHDDAEALAFAGNPVDHTKQILDAQIPVFHICGDSDIVVPYSENTGLFKSRYQRSGGSLMHEIVKPHIGHHPHSIPNPQPLVDFVEACYKNLVP